MALLARITLGLLTTAIILLAVILGGIRLVLVNIEYFKPEIEYLITQDLAPQIVFSGVSGSMNRFNPVLSIENVSINLPDRSQPLIVNQLEVEFDFWLDDELTLTRQLGLLQEGGVPGSYNKEYGRDTVWPTALVVDGAGIISYTALSKHISDRPDPELLLREVRKTIKT